MTLSHYIALPVRADIVLEGWDDLLPILAEWEGPPVTAITLGLTSPPDLVFEAGQTHEPNLLLGLYSDEAFAFSGASKADLLAECAKEIPAWAWDGCSAGFGAADVGH